MINLLKDSPLLLLFVVLAVGAPLGKIKIAGVNLGIATVLFTGLAFGALSPGIKLPAIIYEFGLVLFIYCIGISSGEQFFGNLRKKGWRESTLAFVAIIFAFVLVLIIHRFTSLPYTYLGGIFAGSLTNTPALASSLEFIKTIVPTQLIEETLAEPVVAYSVSYPMGVVGMILAILLFQKLAKTSLKTTDEVAAAEKITNATVDINQKDAIGKTLYELKSNHKLNVVFGRVKREGNSFLAIDSVVLKAGDQMTIVGKPAEVEQAITLLGQRSAHHLEVEHQQLDIRRVFVSNHEIIGQSLKDLELPHTMGIIITRIRRGDTDILPTANTTLQFGDRVRILTGRNEMAAASKFFGDSYIAQSHIDILTLSLGMAAGFLLGMVEVPLPGGISFKLGIAGGPLVVALLLGAVNRVGRLTFVMPYSANHTIRQLGLVLFLAGVGTRSGYAFRETLTNSQDGFLFFLLGTGVTLSVAFFFLTLGHYWLKIPFARLSGMLAGVQTQPAVLAFVNEQTKSELPNIGYSSVFPVATLSKIILIQILFTLLS
jgi:putative transport protein